MGGQKFSRGHFLGGNILAGTNFRVFVQGEMDFFLGCVLGHWTFLGPVLTQKDLF